MADTFAHTVDSRSTKHSWFTWWGDTGKPGRTGEGGSDVEALIHERLDEVKQMISKTRRAQGVDVVATLSEAKQNLVKTLSETHPETFTRSHRKDWRLIDIFRYAVRMTIMVNKVTIWNRMYVDSVLEEAHMELHNRRKLLLRADVVSTDDVKVDKVDNVNDDAESGIKAIPDINIYSMNVKKSLDISYILKDYGELGPRSTAWELRMILETPSYNRTDYMIHRIKWLIKATKAFKDMFPDDMSDEVARLVGYEVYSNGRIIAEQNEMPWRLYFVLEGRINILKKYILANGHITKSMGFINKGETSDVEEIENYYMRTAQFVAKGQVEVLFFHNTDFQYLRKTHLPLPLEFLKSVYLFNDYPLYKLIELHPTSITFRFYPYNKVICKDISHSSVIYIIQSGYCQLLRHQKIKDVSATKRILPGATLEHVAAAKPFHHATHMEQDQIHKDAEVNIDISKEALENHSLVHKQPSREVEDLKINKNAMSERERRLNMKKAVMASATVNVFARTGLPSVKEDADYDEKINLEVLGENSERKDRRRSSFLSDVVGVLPKRKSNDKDLDGITSGGMSSYLELGVVGPGQVLGMNDICGLVDKQTAIVVSMGAEIVSVSKRMFLLYSDNDTLLKLTKLSKPLVAEPEAEREVERFESWERYKKEVREAVVKGQKRNKALGTPRGNPKS